MDDVINDDGQFELFADYSRPIKTSKTHNHIVKLGVEHLDACGFESGIEVDVRKQHYLYSRNPIVIDSYGNKKHFDLLVNMPVIGLVLVDCHWQQSRGSTDDKLPSYIHKGIAAGFPVLFVVDGGGFCEKKLRQFKSDAENANNVLGAVSLVGFRQFLENHTN